MSDIIRPARRSAAALSAAGALALTLTSCGGNAADAAIAVSGSSTVAPITEAVARAGGFTVDVAAEGTLDGFTRFCNGDTAINNASVAIPGAGQPENFVAMCEENGVEFIELPVALDALSIVRNERNTFALDMTLDELRAIWSPDSEIRTWQDVRAEWPDRAISRYGRPPGSGTFDYFTHFVVGETGSITSDYRSTDDMGELSAWIANDDDALAFMGVGNYLAADEDHRDRMTNVAVDGVLPALENARDGQYRPLTRPLFLYVSTAALGDDDKLGEFLSYYLAHAADVVPRVYFYPLAPEAYRLAQERFDQRITGTAFDGDPYSEQSVLEVLGS
ncbi:PstS family phosphate ABC transporter substrate-binding protein [Mycobacterium sp. SMC-4]|uniref:PstS family phosphate ABC transporter substrate-binding protein n=1 Tax=Mycobacterium sp. SMC-4 TaxID=2857059 RepID=UPI0021B2ED2E|nr:PstS family phosphate ABC transporter substrate-binding protein [Mycobacterium sp. SMC-4]